MKILHKKIFFSFIFAFFISFAFCEDFSENKIEKFELENGIPVFVRNEKGSNFKTLSVLLSGGTSYYTREESGIEKAVFDAIMLSSEHYTFAQIDEIRYRTQGSIFSMTAKPGTIFSLKCIDYYFDEVFGLFEDFLFYPTFNEKKFNDLKNDYISGVQSRMNTPVSLLMYYANQIIFEDSQGFVRPEVLPESLENITLENVKKFYSKMFNAKRFCIIAVGDFSTEELKQKLNKNFAKIKPAEDVKDLPMENKKISGKPSVFVHPSAEGAAQVFRFFKGPSVTDDDYCSFEIACNIYSDVLFNVVREHFGDCYTPSASSTGGGAVFGYEMLYNVSNIKDFASHLKIARDIMQKGFVVSGKDENNDFILEPISSRLKSYINSFKNSKFIDEQTTFDLNFRMAGSYLYFKDVSKSQELFKRIDSVTTDSVLTAFKKYFVDESSRYFAVVGENEEDKISFDEK